MQPITIEYYQNRKTQKQKVLRIWYQVLEVSIYHDHTNNGDAEASIVEIQVAQHVFEHSNWLSTSYFPQCINHLPRSKTVSIHIDRHQHILQLCNTLIQAMKMTTHKCSYYSNCTY